MNSPEKYINPIGFYYFRGIIYYLDAFNIG